MAERVSSTRLNATAASLLGLLAIEGWPRPWTSYELTKQARRSLHWFWPRAERQLFAVPRKLVKLGYAKAHDHPTGKRPGTRYEITAAGRDALQAWLGESGPSVNIEAEELIRVFFADQGSIDQLHATLRRIARNAAIDRQQLANVAADMDRRALQGRANVNALSIKLVADLHVTVERWAAWAIEETANWRSPQDSWEGARQVFADGSDLSNPESHATTGPEGS